MMILCGLTSTPRHFYGEAQQSFTRAQYVQMLQQTLTKIDWSPVCLPGFKSEIIIYRVTDPGPVQCSGSSVAAGAGRRENKVSIRGIFLTKWWRKDKQPMLLLYEWC